MPIAAALADFKASLSQCNNLVANAHQTDASGAALFSALDRKQITTAAFLNMFVAWEAFLERTLALFMVGSPTINGAAPVRYVTPPTVEIALGIIVGPMKYFDYANNEYVKKIAGLYFQNGGPYQPHIDSLVSDLADLRTIRNACAHTSTTTQKAMDTLALRIFGAPHAGITPYDILTRTDPKSTTGDTVFQSYQKKIVVGAELIANG